VFELERQTHCNQAELSLNAESTQTTAAQGTCLMESHMIRLQFFDQNHQKMRL